jgi:hypothetical protein
LKAGTGSDLALLNSLPADSLGYYALQCDISKFMAWGMDMAQSVITDEKVLESLKGANAEMKKVKFNGMAGAVNLSKSSSGLVQAVTLISMDDPKKFRALTQKYSEAMKGVEANGVKTEITFKADAEKIGTTSVDVASGKITISDDAPNADQQRAIMKVMYGEGGMTTRSAYLKDKVLQVMGGSKATMEAALKAVESTSRTPAASIQAVRAKLGAKPNFVGLLDLPNAIVKALGIVKELAGDQFPLDPDDITKGLSLKQSYLGFGIEVQDAAVSVKTVLPVDQIKGIVQIGMKAQAAQAGN